MQRKSRKGLNKNLTRPMQLKNGQIIATIPREFVNWKHITRDSLLKWSDAGENRVLIEVIKEGL